MLFDSELKQKYATFEGFFILNSYKSNNIIPLEHAKFWWMFLGVGAGYPLSCWVVSRFWHWFLRFLIGCSVMTSNKKTKTQKNCCCKKATLQRLAQSYLVVKIWTYTENVCDLNLARLVLTYQIQLTRFLAKYSLN